MNNFLFNYFATKIKRDIIGQRIANVSANLNTIILRLPNGSSIFFKLDSQSALFFGNYTIEKTQNTFAVSLQKKINKLKIIDVDFEGLERVLTLHLLDKRLDIEHHYYLIFEITGRNGNLILCDANKKIIETYRLIENRQILPNRIYKEPNKMLDIILDDIDVLKKSFNKNNILGIDNFIKKFITQENIDSFIEVARKPFEALFKYSLNEKFVVYPFLFDFGLDVSKIDEKDLFNQIFTQNTQTNSNNTKFISLINKKINKLNDKIEKIQTDIEKTQNAEKFKQYADTLLANINLIKPHKDFVCLKPNDSVSITIPINPKKTIQDNINTYYKLYKKYKNAKNILNSVLDQVQQERFHLLQIKEQILNNKIDIKDVKILLNKKTHQKVISADTISYEHFSILGFDVYIGKNAKGNDLILKNASKEDIWMHPKNIPGPHLILKNPKRLQHIDKNLLEQCAQKIREKLGTNDKIEVDYTFVKFVKKPKGFKKGRVIYSNFKTVMVG